MIEQLNVNNSNKKLNIKIYPVEADVIELTEADILNSNSVSINYKCGSDSDFSFASVYAAECTFSFKSDVDRYTLYDARVDVFCGNGTDYIGKGVYYISEATRQNNYVSIKAYDRMLLLDVDVDVVITGTVFDIMSHLSDKFGIELGMSEEEINSLPNAGYIYSISADIIGTWRDALYYLSAVTCTFAMFDGEGKLQLRKFHEDTDMEFDRCDRSNPSVSDYETSYDGVKARFVLNGVYKQYVASDVDSPQRIYDAGDIPIVRLTENQQQQILSNMLAEVLKINYVPVSMKIRFNPFIELGDRIVIHDANRMEDSVYSYVMSLTWSFRGLTQIKSVGNNPKLSNVKNSSEKKLSDLEGTISTKNVIVHSYTNIKQYTIKETETEIININYSAEEDTSPIFIATIPIILNLDGNVILKYYIDGVLNEDDVIKKYLSRGQHFVTISNNFKIDKDARRTLSITMCTQYFESDLRIQEAKINSMLSYIESGQYIESDINNSAPIGQIQKYGIKAILFAQGITGTEEWDGTINISETFSAINISVMPVSGFSVDLVAEKQTPHNNVITEVFGAVPITTIGIVGFNDFVEGAAVVTHHIISTQRKDNYIYDEEFVEAESVFCLKIENGLPEPQTVQTDPIDISDASITGIESVTVAYTGTPAFAISFDGGETWKMHNGISWVMLSAEVSGMQAETLMNITSEQWQEQIAGVDAFLVRFTLQAEEDTVESILIDFTN